MQEAFDKAATEKAQHEQAERRRRRELAAAGEAAAAAAMSVSSSEESLAEVDVVSRPGLRPRLLPKRKAASLVREGHAKRRRLDGGGDDQSPQDDDDDDDDDEDDEEDDDRGRHGRTLRSDIKPVDRYHPPTPPSHKLPLPSSRRDRFYFGGGSAPRSGSHRTRDGGHRRHDHDDRRGGGGRRLSRGMAGGSTTEDELASGDELYFQQRRQASLRHARSNIGAGKPYRNLNLCALTRLDFSVLGVVPVNMPRQGAEARLINDRGMSPPGPAVEATAPSPTPGISRGRARAGRGERRGH